MSFIDNSMKSLSAELSQLLACVGLRQPNPQQVKAIHLLAEAERAARRDDKISMSSQLEAIRFEERQWMLGIAKQIGATLAEEALIVSYETAES